MTREAIDYVHQIAEIFSVTTGNPWPEDAKKIGALLDSAIKDVRADCDEAMRQIGELHASQIEGWEDEVRQTEGQRDAEKARADGLDARMAEVVADLASSRKISRDWQENAMEWKKTAEEREKQNNQLLDDLHNMSTELAEMRGYIRRVEMYDPLSERELQDRAERPMVPFKSDRDIQDRDGYAMEAATRDTGRSGTPWYRRRPL